MTPSQQAAMRTALEALSVASSCLDGYSVPRGKTTRPEIENAEAALRAALDEPAQEPVEDEFEYEASRRGHRFVRAAPQKAPIAQPKTADRSATEKMVQTVKLWLGSGLPTGGAPRLEIAGLAALAEAVLEASPPIAQQAPAVAPNLACKSVQARLAAQWGYVKAPAVAPLTDEQIDHHWRATYSEGAYRAGSFDWFAAGWRKAEQFFGTGVSK